MKYIDPSGHEIMGSPDTAVLTALITEMNYQNWLSGNTGQYEGAIIAPIEKNTNPNINSFLYGLSASFVQSFGEAWNVIDKAWTKQFGGLTSLVQGYQVEGTLQIDVAGINGWPLGISPHQEFLFFMPEKSPEMCWE